LREQHFVRAADDTDGVDSADNAVDMDAATALSELRGEQPDEPGSKPELQEFEAPLTSKHKPKPRIQVVRGNAKVELMTQGNHGTTTHVVKLPDPGSVVAGKPRHEHSSAPTDGLMARLQTRLARVFHI